MKLYAVLSRGIRIKANAIGPNLPSNMADSKMIFPMLLKVPTTPTEVPLVLKAEIVSNSRSKKLTWGSVTFNIVMIMIMKAIPKTP